MEKPTTQSLPTSAGVYLYKDKSETVIYVGKARNLRKRLLSYFRKDICAKTAAMLRQAFSIDTITTTTEKEALLLEASLIKKYRPRYNIVLRDDKSYVLFKIALNDSFPRLEIVRTTSRKKNDGARYFGPYVSALAARQTYKLIHRIFSLRRCKDRAFKNRIKPCLYFHIEQCQAPCMGYIDSKQYHERVKSVVKLLEGRTDDLLQTLKHQMLEASEILDFENARVLRDQIKAIESTLERQSVILSKNVSLDAIGLHRTAKGMALSALFIRSGSLNGARSFFWSGLDWEDAPQLLYTFLSQFYANINPPARIILPWLPSEQIDLDAKNDATASTILHNNTLANENNLAGDNNTSITNENTLVTDDNIPVTDNTLANDNNLADGDNMPVTDNNLADGDNTSITNENALADGDNTSAANSGDIYPCANIPFNHQIIALASKGTSFESDSMEFLESTLSELGDSRVRISLAHNIDEHRLIDMATENARQEAKRFADTPMPDRLAAALHLEHQATRIECVDVSHISGQHTKVGLVVFEESKPLPSAYRQYSMPDSNSDDYATLAAWVLKRLKSGPPWPDLLLIDGGKGQLSAVQKALTNAGQPSLFPLAAIAKARNIEGHADRRAGNVNDRIFIPHRLNPLPLKEGCPELLFLQLVRDTTHNFVIGKHRQARNSAALAGELIRIPGVGTKTARLLWNHFENIQAMRNASLTQLQQIPGIGKYRASKIFEKLQKGI